MKLMHINVVIFCALILCFAPLSNCLFLRNPLNWFRFGSSNSPPNQIESNTENVSLSEQTVPSPATPAPTHSDQQLPPFLPIQPIQLQPMQQIQPLSVNQPMQPFIGVPIKMNRFGLEPLPYPLKRIPSKYPALDSSYLNSNQDLNLNRRFGDLNENSNVQSTESPINQEVNPTEEYFSTFKSIKESKDDSIMKQNIENSYQSEYQIDEQLSEENEENSSPTPVYISSTSDPRIASTPALRIASTTASTLALRATSTPDSRTASTTTSSTNVSDGIPSESTESTTQYKPSFLHREDFASQLNNMYYNRPDIFHPMMKQFNTKDI